jgi:large subunit ribosomal protein L4
MALGALRSALSAKLRDGELKVVRAFDLPDHKTKSLAAALKTLEIARKVLVIDVIPVSAETSEHRNLMLSSRNVEGLTLVPSREVTVYDLLNHKQVLLTEAAARKLSEALAV